MLTALLIYTAFVILCGAGVSVAAKDSDPFLIGVGFAIVVGIVYMIWHAHYHL